MTTLPDLTLKQLVAAYIGLTGIEVGTRFFNTKRAGTRRLEALIAEKNLTLADVLKAAGIDADEPADTSPALATPTLPPCPALDDIEADEDGCEPEQIGSYSEDDIPGTEDPPEPGMVWNELEQTWEHPAKASDTAVPASPDAEPELAEPEPPDAAAILTSSLVINDTRDWLVRYLIDNAGLDPETAVLAALRAVTALKLPEPAAQPATAQRQPRTGTKQETILALLRRPEGATIAQIVEVTGGWMSHTCRGFLAGLKKKGFVVTSEKPADGSARTYHLPT